MDGGNSVKPPVPVFDLTEIPGVIPNGAMPRDFNTLVADSIELPSTSPSTSRPVACSMAVYLNRGMIRCISRFLQAWFHRQAPPVNHPPAACAFLEQRPHALILESVPVSAPIPLWILSSAEIQICHAFRDILFDDNVHSQCRGKTLGWLRLHAGFLHALTNPNQADTLSCSYDISFEPIAGPKQPPRLM